jgi:hypothetical protein
MNIQDVLLKTQSKQQSRTTVPDSIMTPVTRLLQPVAPRLPQVLLTRRTSSSFSNIISRWNRLLLFATHLTTRTRAMRHRLKEKCWRHQHTYVYCCSLGCTINGTSCIFTSSIIIKSCMCTCVCVRARACFLPEPQRGRELRSKQRNWYFPLLFPCSRIPIKRRDRSKENGEDWL